MTTTEYSIHSIIKNFPYLVKERFVSMKLKHEWVYSDGTRSDFVFEDSTLIVVIEVKKGQIDKRMICQLDGYIQNERKSNPQKKVDGILVGLGTIDKEVLQMILEKGYSTKFLDDDVPTRIKICAKGKCRRATNYASERCPYCGSRKFVQDPFLFL